MHYRISIYSQIDHSWQKDIDFKYEIEAKDEMIKLEDEVAKDLCYMELEEVYE